MKLTNAQPYEKKELPNIWMYVQ